MFSKLRQYYQFTIKELLFWFVSWSILGLILAQTEIADAYRGGFSGFSWEPWSWSFTAVYAYALITPLIVFFCDRWRYEKKQYLTTSIKLILLYVPTTLAFISLMLAFRFIVYWLVLDQSYPTGDIITRYIYEFPKTLPFYFVVVFVTYTRFYQRQLQQQQISAAKLNVELLDAKLAVLQHQLQPHFLFNTLNLISSIMYRDVDKADSIIARLADMLRYSLASKDQPFISLQRELEVMDSYLQIAQLRFGERLSINRKISAKTLTCKIPVMLLQPLLENAIQYGIEPADSGGTITLETAIEADQLLIRILNSLYPQSNKNASFGIGLENTRNRLQYIYPQQHSLSLKTIDQNQMELLIKLPIEPIKYGQ